MLGLQHHRRAAIHLHAFRVYNDLDGALCHLETLADDNDHPRSSSGKPGHSDPLAIIHHLGEMGPEVKRLCD
jgi:hypothetical protein